MLLSLPKLPAVEAPAQALCSAPSPRGEPRGCAEGATLACPGRPLRRVPSHVPPPLGTSSVISGIRLSVPSPLSCLGFVPVVSISPRAPKSQTLDPSLVLPPHGNPCRTPRAVAEICTQCGLLFSCLRPPLSFKRLCSPGGLFACLRACPTSSRYLHSRQGNSLQGLLLGWLSTVHRTNSKLWPQPAGPE